MLFADLHIHSRFARACSPQLTLPNLYKWCQYKGITVLGTGDFTHPAWFKELKEQLEREDNGFYQLKKQYRKKEDLEIPKNLEAPVYFVPSAETSHIYKDKDKVRRLHVHYIAPDLETVEKVNKKLASIGNIKSDGRPILGLPVRDLTEILLEISDKIQVIPAHIWTPWFALFGSKSGYDAIEDAFGDMTPYIYALETGLSSDPPMNWRWSALDKYVLLSHSDSHSPWRIGREADIFDFPIEDFSYEKLYQAIKTGNGLEGTVEFFPQEGRYHYDGHRKCGICWSPMETKKHKSICSKCKKEVTVGVLHRISALADNFEKERQPKGARSYRKYVNAVPMDDVLSSILKRGVKTQTVQKAYFDTISNLGNELYVLAEASREEIARYNPDLATAIINIRKGKVDIKPGYDGEYGRVEVVLDKKEEQQGLLDL